MTTPSRPGSGDGPEEPTPPQQGSPWTSGPALAPDSPPVTFEGQTFAGAPQQPEAKKSGAKKGLLLGAVAVVTLGVAGTAIAAGSFLSGGGKQPEEVLPKDAIGFAKIDFDPAAGQKVALYRLAQKFPDAEVKSQESLKDDLLARLFAEDKDIDYAADVKPWIGDRIGFVALPDGDDENNEPDVMAAIAFTDKGKAEKSLPKVFKNGDDDPAFTSFSEAGDYVLVGESQKAVDAAAKASSSLAEDKAYGKAVDTLDGDQIVTVWADAAAAWAAVPAETKAKTTEQYGKDFDPKGQFIGGLRADASFLEMTGRGVDFSTGVEIAQLGTGEGSGLLREFPDDLLAGASVTGLGDALSKGFDQFSEALGDASSIQDFEDQVGIKLPEDLKPLLGDETALGVYGTQDDPQVVGRTRGGDADAALAVGEKLREAVAGPAPSASSTGGGAAAPSVKKFDDGIAFGTSPEALDRVAATGKLGSTPAFQLAVPGAEGATVILYADVERLLAMFKDQAADLDDDGKALRNLQVLRGFGVTATGGENAEFRLRVTVK